jgi:hypothetical protein
MDIRVWTGVALLLAAGTAFAQRPLVYPLRSQPLSIQSVDNALCYAQAKAQTGVDIARQPQRPFRSKPIGFASDAGSGTSQPPLPASQSQSQGEGAAANAPRTAGGATPASGTPQAASAASAPRSASGSSAGSESTTAAASQPGAASEIKLPSLPPPEPPMTTYWRAYGDCMQSRGYAVR